jgi:glycosyltransferase involved in cell wall biosynthesis
MRISIILGPFHPLPPAGFGAVEKVWAQLARAFAARGHAICVLGRSTDDGQALARDGVRVLPMRGFDATGHLPFDLAKDLLYATLAAWRVPRSDIIVTNSFWSPVALGLLRGRKGRVVVHVARFPKGQMWLYRGADVLQAVSSTVARAIAEQQPGLAVKVRMLGNPVDLATFTPRPDERASGAAREILYVGRVHPEKGLRLLVQAFRRVAERAPDIRLRIVGPVEERHGGGGDTYLSELRSDAAGLNVSFEGAVAAEGALAELYRRCDCFCYPSLAERGEASPRAVLEAMASGAACVVSSLSCFLDFVQPGENALVFEHRAADAAERLAVAIRSVLDDAAQARRLGRAARSTALGYSIDRVAEDYLRLFQATLAAP